MAKSCLPAHTRARATGKAVPSAAAGKREADGELKAKPPALEMLPEQPRHRGSAPRRPVPEAHAGLSLPSVPAPLRSASVITLITESCAAVPIPPTGMPAKAAFRSIKSS